MNQVNNITRDLPPEVGQNIRRLRQTRKLSCNKCAIAAGVSPSFLHRIEKGERSRMSYSILKNVADVLGCSIESITGQAEASSIPSADELRFKFLQMLEKIVVSDLTYEETMEQLGLVLKISGNLSI